jgi:Methyltransferase domain
MTFTCPLCGGAAGKAFEAEVLGKHVAEYGACPGCGLLFAHEPAWLSQAYDNPIAELDTGILVRNLYNVARVTAIISVFFERHARFLDYAGGYGFFVRLMRDVGFDFYWQDKHCANLLAKHFEMKSGESYSLVTAMEVLEHVPDPLRFVEGIVDETGSDNLLFSTTTFEGAPPPPDWPYYAFESGQHITFYQPRTLEWMARKLGFYYFRGGDLHLFTRRKINRHFFRLTASKASLLAFPLAKAMLKSRTERDFLSMRNNGRRG